MRNDLMDDVSLWFYMLPNIKEVKTEIPMYSYRRCTYTIWMGSLMLKQALNETDINRG